MKENVDDFLSHHGILGMHWGVRKPKETVSTGSSEANDSNSSNSEAEATKKYLSIKSKPVSKKEAAKELAANKKKFSDKFGPETSDAKKKMDGNQLRRK